MFNWQKTKKPSAPAAPKPHRTPSSSPHPKQSLLSLEQRLMFDAAAAATASEVASEQVAQEQADAAVSSDGSADQTSTEQTESQELLQAIVSYSPGESTTEVAFIDPTVPDYESLIAGMGSNVEIIMLDATRDGMEQIAESLADRSGIDAIHLITHGAEGRLNIGTGALTHDSMTGQYADELATIQQALSEQADILVYGCDFAEGQAGQEAATLLSQLTGADVAASTDATGFAGLGGDWVLEMQIGTVETQVAVDYGVQANWVGLLAGELPPTISNLSGDSLRYSEGAGAVVIEQRGNALVADVDSANFDAGRLTVSIPAGNDSAEDVLTIRNQGTGAGQIGVSGSNVTYGGVTIGTFTGGSSGTDLVVTLNASATPTVVTALVRNITYQDTDTNAPTTGARTVRYVLTDGDGGTSANYDTTVTVSGVNDAPTDLALSASTVAENAATGAVVGTVTGTDVDEGDTKTYSLTNTAGGRFAINASTGVLTVANGSLLNYESAPSHSVTVRVTDRGGLTYDEAFTINLTNVNEAPTGTDATVTISEDTSHTLTTVNFGFSDVDAGDLLSAVRIDSLPGAGTLSLSGAAVTAGQVVTVANINAGNLVFTPAANANGTGYANVTFSVRDAGSTYDAAPNSLTFHVTAINDVPVNTVPGLQTVNEDTALTISGISVTDVDGNLSTVQLGVAQGTLNVTVQGGATISAGANGTGTLTVSGTQADINATLTTLSYQGNVNFTGSDLLTVTSRDSNAVTDVDMVAITVNPVNDAPTDLSLSANTVAENAVNGTVVGTVTGIDVDAGDAKSYSLTGTAGGRFAINSSTGIITVADGSLLNYEMATSHSVTVRVTDSSGATYDETFAINLTNVNEALTDVALSADTVAENATNGTVVGTVTGTDPDAGDTHTYQLTDTAGGRFAINSSTGVITVADSSLLNYEAAPSHSVTVRVTDRGGLTYDEAFTINLTNVNQTPAWLLGGSVSLQTATISTEDRLLQSDGSRSQSVEIVESKTAAHPAYSQEEIGNKIPQDGTRSDVSKEPPPFSPAQIIALTQFLDEMAYSEGPSPIGEILDRHIDEVKQLLQNMEDEGPPDKEVSRGQLDQIPTVLSAWLIANSINLVPTRKPLVRVRQPEGDGPQRY